MVYGAPSDSSSFSHVIGAECSLGSDRCPNDRGSHGDGDCGEDVWFHRAAGWSLQLEGCSTSLG